jgi:hypothetical protein
MKLQQLGPAYLAVPAKWHDVRLRLTPSLQRRSPLLCALHVEDLTAGIQHAAVDPSGVQRRNLTCSHRNHCFIEQRHTLDNLSLPDQRATVALRCERYQILVAEQLADRRSLLEHRLRVRSIASVK